MLGKSIISRHTFFITIIIFTLFELFDKIKVTDWFFGLSQCNKTKTFFVFIFLLVSLTAYYQTILIDFFGLNMDSKWNFMGNGERYLGFTKWNWSHFFAYLIYALICSKDWKFVIIQSFGFELLESFAGLLSENTKYWTGSEDIPFCVDDIKANLLGYFVGCLLRPILISNKKL